MKLSVVIITFNRCDALRRTLAALSRDPALSTARAGQGDCEIIVVDNASTDGTVETIRREHPDVAVIGLESNVGTHARNVGVGRAQGEYVLFLDDDSFPLGDTIERALARLDANTDVAALGGRVTLPDGSGDAAAMPLVIPACALFVRRAAYQQVGGIARELFLQAEEYDLAFRLLAAGWRFERFEDLAFHHEKTPISRNSARICRLDLRNNLILAGRHLPRPWRRIYRRDWLQRYIALARHSGCEEVIGEAIRSARRVLRGVDDSRHGGEPDCSEQLPAESQRKTAHSVLNGAALELFFEHDAQARAVRRWAAEHGVDRVIIADLSKNIYATWRACRLAGLAIDCIADPHPAFHGLTYRGVAVRPDADALGESAAVGVVVSTVNPARVETRAAAVEEQFGGPVLRLWSPRTLGDAAAIPAPASPAAR